MLYEIVQTKKKPGVQSIGRSFASETTTCRPPAPAPRTLRTHERPRLRPPARSWRAPSVTAAARPSRAPAHGLRAARRRHPRACRARLIARATPRPPRSRRLRARTYGGKKNKKKGQKRHTPWHMPWHGMPATTATYGYCGCAC